MEPAYKLLTVEEFLDSCPNDNRHYELFDGVIVAMAPPAIAHQRIAGNLAFELGGAVPANRPDCAVGSQAGIAPQGLSGRNYFEADIAVTCRFANDYRGINAEPLLIVEIQSPSTERDDHFVKLPQYRRSRAFGKSSISKASVSPRLSIAATPPESGRRSKSPAGRPGCTCRRSVSTSRLPQSIASVPGLGGY